MLSCAHLGLAFPIATCPFRRRGYPTVPAKGVPLSWYYPLRWRESDTASSGDPPGSAGRRGGTGNKESGTPHSTHSTAAQTACELVDPGLGPGRPCGGPGLGDEWPMALPALELKRTPLPRGQTPGNVGTSCPDCSGPGTILWNSILTS